MRLENTWQEIRNHSFIQNHSRPFRYPAPWQCFFCSVHLSHFLQGSGQRTGMAIAEAWFCAQWPIFVLFLGFVFGLLSSWKIQTWPIIRFLTLATETVTHWFFICWGGGGGGVSSTTRNVGTFYPCVHQTHLECLLLRRSFFCFIWP